MKKLMITSAMVAAALASYAATPKELIDAGKYRECVDTCPFPSVTNIITRQNAERFMVAAAQSTNYNYLSYISKRDLISIDDIYEMAKACSNELYSYYMQETAFYATTNEAWRVEILQRFWNNRTLHDNNRFLSVLIYGKNISKNPDQVLEYSQLAIQNGFYPTAAASYRASVKDEKFERFCIENFMKVGKYAPLLTNGKPNTTPYFDVFRYVFYHDRVVLKDSNLPKTLGIYNKNFNHDQFFYSIRMITKLSLKDTSLANTILRDYIINTEDCETYFSKMMLCANMLDDAHNNNDGKLLLYDKLANAGCGYGKCLDLAIRMNDVDKIIDQLLRSDKNITAAQAGACIEPINAVEADYRKADILKALNNVNSRCTIKLYEDAATWEPILSKIRGLISVRK